MWLTLIKSFLTIDNYHVYELSIILYVWENIKKYSVIICSEILTLQQGQFKIYELYSLSQASDYKNVSKINENNMQLVPVSQQEDAIAESAEDHRDDTLSEGNFILILIIFEQILYEARSKN